MNEDQSLTMLEQLADLVGFSSYNYVVYDIFGLFFLLFGMCVLFNITYVLITSFLRSHHG